MPRSIRKTYRIKAPLFRVWRCFRDGVGMTGWFPERACSFQPMVGSPIVVTFTGDVSVAGKITDYVPGKRFGFLWTLGVKDGREAFSQILFELAEVIDSRGGRSTYISLSDTGIPDESGWVEYYAETCAGWSYYLMNLKSVCETGYDLRDSETVDLCQQ